MLLEFHHIPIAISGTEGAANSAMAWTKDSATRYASRFECRMAKPWNTC